MTNLEAPVEQQEAPSLRLPSGRWLTLLNVFMSWACQVVSVAGGLVVTPTLIHALGEHAYGSWLLVSSFVAQLRTLDLGMSLGTLKFSAGALARGDARELRRIHSSSAAMFILAASLALLATGVMVLVLPRVFPAALGGYAPVIFVAGLASTLDLLFHPQPASLRSRSYYFVPDSVEVSTYLVFKLGLVMYLAATGMTLWLLALLILGESIVRNLLNAALGFWLCEWTRHVSPRLVDRTAVGRLTRYGAGSLLINVGEAVRLVLATSTIGFFQTGHEIAVYSIGVRLIHIAAQTIGVISGIAVPKFSGAFEKGDQRDFERLLAKASRVTDYAAVYFLVNIAVLGLPFLRLWIRQPWVGDAFAVTLIVLPGYLVGLLTYPAQMAIMGSGRLRGLGVLTVAEGITNLVLSTALVWWLGMYGAAIALLVTMVAFRGVAFPFVLRASTGVPIRAYLRPHLRSVWLVIPYGLLVAPVLLAGIDGFVEFVLAGLATSAVYALLLFVAVPDLRQRVVARLTRTRRG